MILPNVRASFGREEVDWLMRLLAGGSEGSRRIWERRLTREGLDPLLDDPRSLEALLDGEGIRPVPARLALYLLVRHALLEVGVEGRMIADYVTALVLEFGRAGRSTRIDPDDEGEYRYLVQIVEELERAEGRRAFLLQAHLGNLALWTAGLFPDRIARRMRRKGGPDLGYYEAMGQTGYRMAADTPLAQRQSLDRLYRDAAEAFGLLRRSLNRLSDRHLFPRTGMPVERLLRQVRDDFGQKGRPH